MSNKENDLVIERMLTLSTIHIDPNVLDRMNDGVPIGCIYDTKDVTGFMIPVIQPPDEWEYKKAPPCIQAALDLALRHQCGYILFDGDGPQTQQLEIYEHR